VLLTAGATWDNFNGLSLIKKSYVGSMIFKTT